MGRSGHLGAKRGAEESLGQVGRHLGRNGWMGWGAGSMYLFVFDCWKEGDCREDRNEPEHGYMVGLGIVRLRHLSSM